MSLTSIDDWVDFTVKCGNWEHYIGLASRTGVRALTGVIEYYHFPPGTPKNAEFELHLIEWHRIEWIAFSTPRAYHGLIQDVSRQMAMTICKNPPSYVGIGPSAAIMTVPYNISAKDLQTELARRGMKDPLLSILCSKREVIPGPPGQMHAIENDSANPVYKQTIGENLEIIQRESQLHEALIQGVRPSIEEILKFLYNPKR